MTLSHPYGPGRASCGCGAAHGPPRFVVVTGGPGAGKTAILEIARQRVCSHVRVLPEAASILFGGGFPRLESAAGARAAQRAIYRVQSELEVAAAADPGAGLVLCDRGTLDGLGYCGGSAAAFLEEIGTSKERELARYATVIHVRTPPAEQYQRDNGIRIEDARRAAAIDARLRDAWAQHPHVIEVASRTDFLDKATAVLAILDAEIPPCCRRAAQGAAGLEEAFEPVA